MFADSGTMEVARPSSTSMCTAKTGILGFFAYVVVVG